MNRLGSESWMEADWPAPPGIRAGTTLRGGGSSSGAFASLNLGLWTGDRVDLVRANRARVVRGLGLPAEPPWLRQVHGARVVRVESGAAAAARADACVSGRAGTVCAVLTADCVPILLCSDDGRRIGAAHAGWRGLLAGVIEATVGALATPPRSLLAWIGPAIGADHYRVGDELPARFAARDHAHLRAFAGDDNGRWHCDLATLARQCLARAGVEAVFGGRWCTARDAERFFSYRRESVTGRMASMVWLESRTTSQE